MGADQPSWSLLHSHAPGWAPLPRAFLRGTSRTSTFSLPLPSPQSAGVGGKWEDWRAGAEERSTVSLPTLARTEGQRKQVLCCVCAGPKLSAFHTCQLLQFRAQTSQDVSPTLGRRALALRSAQEPGACAAPPLSHPGTVTSLSLCSVCRGVTMMGLTPLVLLRVLVSIQ